MDALADRDRLDSIDCKALTICRAADPSILPQSLAHSIAKQEFPRRCSKTMHAEHADSSELNELSGRVIGRAFTVLNTLGAGFPEKVHESVLAYVVRATVDLPRLKIKRVAHGL